MKIEFEDNSYIELTKSKDGDKVFITIAAKSSDNAKSLIVNAVELEKDQFLALMRSLN